MAPWIAQYGNALLRWLGLANDSTAPNLGAMVLVVAFVLLAMGYSPDELGGWVEGFTGLVSKAAEFATKTDNALGIALGFLGLRMLSPGAPPTPPAEPKP